MALAGTDVCVSLLVAVKRSIETGSVHLSTVVLAFGLDADEERSTDIR